MIDIKSKLKKLGYLREIKYILRALVVNMILMYLNLQLPQVEDDGVKLIFEMLNQIINFIR